MKLARRRLLVVFLGLSPWFAAHGAVELTYVRDQHRYTFAGATEGTVLVRDGNETIAPPEGGTWRLEGDVRADFRLFRWTPSYVVSRTWARPREADPQHPLAARVSLQHSTEKQEGNASDRESFFADWPDGLPGGGAAVFIWLLDAHPTQIVVRPLPSTDAGSFFVDATFRLTTDEARGQPIILLWRDGGFIVPRPIFPQPGGDEAIVATLLDDAATLDRIIKRGFKIDSRGRLGITLMHYAAEAGALHTMDLLVAADRSLVNVENNEGSLPVHWAASNGRSAAIARMAAAGANLDRPRKTGLPPLLDAVRHGHTETVNALLAAGARIDAGDERNRGPVAYAVMNLLPQLADLLLEAGAPDSEVQSRGAYYLILAARAENTETLHWLLDRGADPKLRNVGVAPLHAAARVDSAENVTILVAAGADPNVADFEGITPLMIASKANNQLAVAALLDSGAKIDETSNLGSTALHEAARGNAANAVALLIERGAILDRRDHNGLTPLGVAITVGSHDSVTSLLARGAHLRPGSPSAAAELCAAIRRNMDDVLADALANGWSATDEVCAGVSCLALAEMCRASRCVEKLRGAGATTTESARIVAVRDLDSTPSVQRAVQPDDPRPLDEKFPEQTIRVEIVVDADGALRAPRIVSSPDARLDASVLETLAQWRFTPGRSRGRAVATRLELPVRFPASDMRIYESWQASEPPRENKPRPPFRATLRDGSWPKVDALVYRFIVDAQGKVGDVEILQSAGPEIDASLISAVKREEFTPAKRGDKAVPVRITRRFAYKQNSP